MNTNGINVSWPNQFYPMTVPGFQYGQTQPPYVPTPTYQPQTGNQSVTTASQSRPQGVLGHMITSPDQITPQEIPMDGSISLFPMQDGSAVIGSSGTTTVRSRRSGSSRRTSSSLGSRTPSRPSTSALIPLRA